MMHALTNRLVNGVKRTAFTLRLSNQWPLKARCNNAQRSPIHAHTLTHTPAAAAAAATHISVCPAQGHLDTHNEMGYQGLLLPVCLNTRGTHHAGRIYCVPRVFCCESPAAFFCSSYYANQIVF